MEEFYLLSGKEFPRKCPQCGAPLVIYIFQDDTVYSLTVIDCEKYIYSIFVAPTATADYCPGINNPDRPKITDPLALEYIRATCPLWNGEIYEKTRSH